MGISPHDVIIEAFSAEETGQRGDPCEKVRFRDGTLEADIQGRAEEHMEAKGRYNGNRGNAGTCAGAFQET